MKNHNRQNTKPVRDSHVRVVPSGETLPTLPWLASLFMSTYQETADYSRGLVEIINDDGETFSGVHAPESIREAIRNAQERGHASGIVYGSGMRWRWMENLTGSELATIEITRSGEVQMTMEIPLEGWRAFQLLSYRQGFKPEEYLPIVLSGCIHRGMTLPVAINWLFPSKP